MIDSEKLLAPTGLMCNLLGMPDKVLMVNQHLRFGWIVNSLKKDDLQTAYQILVSSSLENIKQDNGNFWDSGKLESGDSTAVQYKGKKLLPNSSYYWKVRVWNSIDKMSPYSEVQRFKTGKLSNQYFTARYPLDKKQVAPDYIVNKTEKCCFIDFGKAVFGTVKLTLESPYDAYEMWVQLGEVAGERKNTINSEPGGSRRFSRIKLKLKKGLHTYTVRIEPDVKNTGPKAIKMPKGYGEVMPFRYCELINTPHKIDKVMVRQVAAFYPFNDKASEFTSSSKSLNDVWDLCKYTIKATSFCGVYVDGDRERVPYEADAYINQLSHYAVDREYSMARYSHEYLITHPAKWPMEFAIYSVFMAWQDYMYTGDSSSLNMFYDDLCAKILVSLGPEDGLIFADPKQFTAPHKGSPHCSEKREIAPIVDWPHPGFAGSKGETDGFEFEPINTVINAYHYRALVLMARIAEVLSKEEDRKQFNEKAARVKRTLNAKLLDKSKGIYIDGYGSKHSSLHANMFPLAFGLVPKEYIPSVAGFIKTRGMACSVYGAQHLLEALYHAGEADYALKLLTSRAKRSWINMIRSGSTMTMEAWDDEYKPNQDWNHAWGAAPANIISRFLMGIQPLEPGYGRIRICPQPGKLSQASIKLPTIKGDICVAFKRKREMFELNISIPANTVADVFLPRCLDSKATVLVNGTKRKAKVLIPFN